MVLIVFLILLKRFILINIKKCSIAQYYLLYESLKIMFKKLYNKKSYNIEIKLRNKTNKKSYKQ